jgi:ABC-type multidrug transport system fused ATPase/permease subunit
VPYCVAMMPCKSKAFSLGRCHQPCQLARTPIDAPHGIRHIAAMLKIDAITYSVEGRPLIDGATATIPTGHKVGLVGRNGAPASADCLLDAVQGR